MSKDLYVVTGAFGFTGKYITRILLSRDLRVRTLTGHPDCPNPFGDGVEVAPFNFDRPDLLTESLAGAQAVFNTYWIRYPHGGLTYEKAAENTKTLIRCAKEAGVQRFVHISITNPSVDSPLPYFRGKAILEETLINFGLSYAILRPAVIFGKEDILINNIAWLLRRFPLFLVPGNGAYKLCPIFVEDLAKIAVDSAEASENLVADVLGPETFTFNDLLSLVSERVGARAMTMHLSPSLALLLSRMMGVLLRDVVLTRDEVVGLASNLLTTDSPPRGWTRLSDWLAKNRHTVGVRYASELARHYRV